MTDTTQFLPNQQGITSDCLFNLKPSAVSSRSYRASISSSNKSVFSNQDTAICYIPARRNCFLDPTQSYVRYTVKNADASYNINFDHNGASVINRLDVFHGSNLLETIQAYNALYTYLLDFGLNNATRAGLSAMYGTNPTISDIVSGRQGQPISKNGNYLTVCMPILSGTVGCLAEKMLPLNLADDIRLEFTLESQNIGMVYSNASPNSAWQIINFELELSIVEMSETGMSMIESVTPFSQPVFLHGSSYRHYVSTLASSSTGGFSTLVPARFASLKSLMCLPRRSTEISSASSYSLSSRANPNFINYWWRIGSLILPQKYVQLQNSSTTGGYAEAFSEIMKSFHALNHAEYAGSLGSICYNVADAADTSVGDAGTVSGVVAINTGANSYKNGFAIGQELESFAQRNDTILSGMNTLGSQVFFEANIGSTGPTASYTLDFYAYYDMILVLQDGLLSIKF